MIMLKDAKQIIEATAAKAADWTAIDIAVADAGRSVIAQICMDGAWPGSLDISMKKAYTSRIRYQHEGLGDASQSGWQLLKAMHRTTARS